MTHSLDRANAFSALLELDPEFKRDTLTVQSAKMTRLLQAYYAPEGPDTDKVSVFDFAEAWWRKQQGEAAS